MLAAWPLYTFSRRELAPVEDQSHISLFMRGLARRVARRPTNRASLEVVQADHGVPRGRVHVVADRPAGAASAAWSPRTGRSAQRSTEQMYGEVFGAVSQVPGLRVFPRLDPPLPTPGQYDVELVLQSDAPPEQMLETVGAGGRRRLAERQVPVRGHRPQDRPARGAGGDRPRAGGRPRASTWPASARSWARCSAAATSTGSTSTTAATRSSRRSARRTGPRSARCSTSRSRRRAASWCRCRPSPGSRPSTAPRTLNRFQQRNAVRIFGGVKPGVTKEEGLQRPGGRRGGRGRPGHRRSTTPASRGRSAARARR